MSQQEKKGPV